MIWQSDCPRHLLTKPKTPGCSTSVFGYQQGGARGKFGALPRCMGLKFADDGDKPRFCVSPRPWYLGPQSRLLMESFWPSSMTLYPDANGFRTVISAAEPL